MRADGLPTQHMRSLAYWMAAPELEGMTSMQVCGSEWVSHVTCRRKLMSRAAARRRETAACTRAAASSTGWSPARSARCLQRGRAADRRADRLARRADRRPIRELRAVRRAHPAPERIAAQVALGYFVPHPVDARHRLRPRAAAGRCARASAGTSCARVRATGRDRSPDARGEPCARTPTTASRWCSRSSTAATCASRWSGSTSGPLAHYLKHLARWYLERERSEPVERVVHTLLDRSARGLGLEAAP